MKKSINSILFLILAYGLPLIYNPILLIHPKVLLLIFATFLVFQTQPAVDFKEGKREQQKDKYSVFLILSLSLIALLAPIIEWAYFKIPSQNLTVWTIVGLIFLIGGIGLRIYAIKVLGRFFTAAVEIQDSHDLIQTGPYAFIRHPSYTGAFMAFIGSGLFLEAWVGTLIAFISMSIAYWYRIKNEEIALTEKFGKTYESYQNRTHKLIPFIW